MSILTTVATPINDEKPRKVLRFMSASEAMEYANISRPTFYAWIKKGLPVRSNPFADPTKKVYLKEDIDQFKASLTADNPSDSTTGIKEVSSMQPTLKHNTLTTKQRLTALEERVKELQKIVDKLQISAVTY